MKETILMITSSFPRYEGDFFGPWILDYCRELADQNVNVIVLAPRVSSNILDALSNNGVIIKRFNYWPVSSSQNLVSPPGMIPQLKANPLRMFQIPFLLYSYYKNAVSICKEYKIDIVHCQWIIPAGFIGVFLKLRFGIPLVITSQGAELYLPTKHPFSWATKYTIKYCDRLLPVSAQMALRAFSFGATNEQTTVISNSIDTNKFKKDYNTHFREENGIPEDALIIITVRRLVPEKRVIDVLKAFELIDHNQEVYLVIAGDGPEKKDLVQYSQTMTHASRVIFLGFVDNDELPKIYAASNIYILSSQQEGLSLTLLEALSSELIVISTTGTGANEIIAHGQNGFLYEVGDFMGLKDVINTILTLPVSDQKQLVTQARQRVVDQYSITKMVAKWKKEYTNLLGSHD